MEARLGLQLDRLPERTIRDVRLFEFGPTTWPAYSDATAGLGGQWTPARWEGALVLLGVRGYGRGRSVAASRR